MNTRHVKSALVTGACLLLAALPAAPAAAQSSDAESWTGPYVGGRLGYAFQRSDKDETVLFDTDLDGSFDNTVTTGTGATPFARFCGGRRRLVPAPSAAPTTVTAPTGLSCLVRLPDGTSSSDGSEYGRTDIIAASPPQATPPSHFKELRPRGLCAFSFASGTTGLGRAARLGQIATASRLQHGDRRYERRQRRRRGYRPGRNRQGSAALLYRGTNPTRAPTMISGRAGWPSRRHPSF